MTPSPDPNITLALIGVVSTVIGALFKLLNDNTKALQQLAASSDKIAEATHRGNEEAKERNGHLGEQNVQIAQLITSQGSDVSSIKDSSLANSKTNRRVEQFLEKQVDKK